jgi:hypothetical protein
MFFPMAAGVSSGGGGGGWTPNPAAIRFNGDYSTGNFNQWATMQNHRKNDPPATAPAWPLTGNYEAQIVTDGVKGTVARYECRDGDTLLGFPDNTERTEVRQLTGESNGETFWYEFAFRVDNNPNAADWGVLQQWHTDDAHNDIPPLQFGWTNWDGANADYLVRIMSNMAWHVPYRLGQWDHITLEVKWSPASDGYIKMWYNRVRQLLNGSITYNGPTQRAAAVGVYFKEGIYRSEFAANVAVVWQHGFRSCTSPTGLTWDITTA